MGRKSSIRKLPIEIRKEVDRMLDDANLTQDDIVRHLQALGAQTSQSAISRYNRARERLNADIRWARELALGTAKDLKDLAEADSLRVLIESLTALALQIRTQIRDDIGEKELLHLGTKLTSMVRDLTLSQKLSVDAEVKAKEWLRKAEARLEKEAPAKGLSSDMVQWLRSRILFGEGER